MARVVWGYGPIKIGVNDHRFIVVSQTSTYLPPKLK